jgi:CII-binding regulator of phage lambda lysogenization HflD
MQFDGKTLEDYNNLSNKIKKHLDVLTSSCTMTGQGHDELHKWLLPFLDISKEFAKSKTLKDAQENYQVIKHSFNLVDKNFK